MMTATFVALLLTASPQSPKLLILDLTPAGGVEPAVASALTEAISVEVGRQGFFEVATGKDVQTLLGLNRQKQMAGCSEDSTNCLTELAGAFGARFVMTGSLAKLGAAYQLTLQALDTRKAQPIGRTTRLAHELDALRAQIPMAVAEATGSPLPPPPSRVLPYSMIGAGALFFIAGAIVGVDGFSRDRSLSQELARGQAGTAPLRSVQDYKVDASFNGTEKTVALISMVTGAVLGGAGLLINPPDNAVGTVAKVAVIPTWGGIGLVGTWP